MRKLIQCENQFIIESPCEILRMVLSSFPLPITELNSSHSIENFDKILSKRIYVERKKTFFLRHQSCVLIHCHEDTEMSLV